MEHMDYEYETEHAALDAICIDCGCDLQADRDACRRVLAHLSPDLLDSLAIALAEDGDNTHALQLAAAARELRALESKEE